jgi:hypothetical protein
MDQIVQRLQFNYHAPAAHSEAISLDLKLERLLGGLQAAKMQLNRECRCQIEMRNSNNVTIKSALWLYKFRLLL